MNNKNQNEIKKSASDLNHILYFNTKLKNSALVKHLLASLHNASKP